MSKEYKNLIHSMPLDHEHNVKLPKKPNLIAIKMQNTKRKRIIRDEYNLHSYENSLIAQQTSLPSLSNKPPTPVSAKVNNFDLNTIFSNIHIQHHAHTNRPSSNVGSKAKNSARNILEQSEYPEREEPAPPKTISAVNLVLNVKPEQKLEPYPNRTPNRSLVPYESKDPFSNDNSRPSSQSGVNRTKLVRLFGNKSPMKPMNQEVYQTIDQFISELKGDGNFFQMMKVSSRSPSRVGTATQSLADSAPRTPGLEPMKRVHARSSSDIPVTNLNNNTMIKSVKTPQVIQRKRKAVSISVSSSKPGTPNPFAGELKENNLLFGYIPPNPYSELLHDKTRIPGAVNSENCRQAWMKTLNRIEEKKEEERKSRVPKLKTELFLSPYDAYKINNLLRMSMSPIERKRGFKLGKTNSSKVLRKNMKEEK